MSAHAYIRYADIPDVLIESSRQRIEGETGAKLISLAGCPLTGQIEVTSGGRVQVEFSWPRLAELRHALDDWFTEHGIHFTVVM
ncbi:phage portal protein [Paraburkholderia sp. A3BS-1L]|uniref:phage portal protein n=1 Tax=Paraburkholderia sp. A3BS-1L TaxID=3028375 RepID=UPI003DAA1735